MAERRISYAPDVENGGAANLDEYAALNRYISTAQAKRRDSTGSGAEGGGKKKPWWAFWRKSGGGAAAEDGKEEGFVCPEEWLETDIRAGIRSSDVEPRRKRSGWNELAAEKTNLFLQFLGYFQGPILYGEFLLLAGVQRRPPLTMSSHGTRCRSCCRSSGLD